MITSSDEKNVYTFYNEPSTAFDRDQFVKNGDEVTYSFVGRICTVRFTNQNIIEAYFIMQINII